MGIHAVADHFYEPIPNLRQLEARYDENRKFVPAGADWDFARIESDVKGSIEKFGSEFMVEASKYGYRSNHYFQAWDALCLYTYLRQNQITSVVEIGQGFSTLVSLAALGKTRSEGKIETRFVSIDPYSRIESQQSEADRAEVTIIRKPVQDVGADEILSELTAASLLFVDSSHIYKAGSDVEFLMQNVYPHLPSGCHLHVHDIFSPYPWPKKLYTERKWFWNEQQMLEQFMAFNSSFTLRLPAYWLYKDSKVLRESVSPVGEEFFRPGASIYFQKC